jgi:hypothetical protein
MAEQTFVIVDAGMVAGFRRATPSLAQLHQALVHLHLQHPDARVAVVADPSLKWDLGPGEQPAFEGDIIARAVVCAPAGALEGTTGFMTRSAERASTDGYGVVAFTDRALPEVALGRLRNDAGRWVWDLDATVTIDEAASKQARSGNGGGGNRSRRRRR